MDQRTWKNDGKSESRDNGYERKLLEVKELLHDIKKGDKGF